jgi:predicted ATPase
MKMLERLHIENYKCLRDITVDLGDFTILVGPNDSGKSSFMQAVRALDLMLGKSFPKNFNQNVLGTLVWRHHRDQRIKWDVTGRAAERGFHYKVELPADGGPPIEDLVVDQTRTVLTEKAESHGQSMLVNKLLNGGQQQQSQALPGSTFLARNRQADPYKTIARALSSSIEYRFDVDLLKKAAVPKQGDVLSFNGENLAAVLDIMQNSADRSDFDALQGSFKEAVPTLDRFILPPARNGHGKVLEFVLAGGSVPPVTIPASQVSTGALLLMAFLTIAYSCTADVLLIEEPENGLHPSRLEFVVNQLRKICSGEIGGRKRQVIITTHSPLLLNYAMPEEVRVFIRRDNTLGSQVQTMKDIPDLEDLRKEFSTGELWYLLGENKLFEENRT